MATRACWLYSKYARFEFHNQNHLIAALSDIVTLCSDKDQVLPVKVEGILAISSLLDHEYIVDLIRPKLGEILRLYIHVMDEIDLE